MFFTVGDDLRVVQEYHPTPGLGYLVLTRGQVVKLRHIGKKGEDIGWLYGSADGRDGWFPCSSVDPSCTANTAYHGGQVPASAPMPGATHAFCTKFPKAASPSHSTARSSPRRESQWPDSSTNADDFDRTSRRLAALLRHGRNEILMDGNGWANLEDVRSALGGRQKHLLQQVLSQSLDKQGKYRFEQKLQSGHVHVRATRETPYSQHDLDKASRFLARLLRIPEAARENQIDIDPDGWASLQQVKRAMHHPQLLKQVVRTSEHRPGIPRFEIQSLASDEERIRAVCHRRHCTTESPGLSSHSAASFDQRHIPEVQQERTPDADMSPRRHTPGTFAPRLPRTAVKLCVDFTKHFDTFQKLSFASKELHHAVCTSAACRWIMPPTACGLVADYVKSAYTMTRGCVVNQAWHCWLMPYLMCPGVICGGRGRRAMELPCHHKICKECFFYEKKCPRCGDLHSDEDYISLNAHTDPRTSEARAISEAEASDSLCLGASAASPRTRWVCRQGSEAGEPPFAKAAVAAAEAAFAAEVLKQSNVDGLGMRYWRIRHVAGGFVAQVFLFQKQKEALSVKELQKTPEDVMEKLADVSFNSTREFKSEEEAVLNVILQE